LERSFFRYSCIRFFPPLGCLQISYHTLHLVYNTMKKIPLTRGKFALVDDNDFDYLNFWKWCCSTKGHAARGVWDSDKEHMILMHRVILNTPEGIETDHRNGNRLDNRRENIRFCTRSQNRANQRKTRGLSRFKGVVWRKDRSKWRVYITKNRKTMYIGLFDSEERLLRPII